MKTIACPSAITSVVVHARGAIVTRRIPLSDKLSGELLCVVGAVNDRVEEGTARVRLIGGQGRVVALRTRTQRPEVSSEPGPTKQRLEDLRLQLDALTREHRELKERLKRFVSIKPAPQRRKALENLGPKARVEQTLALLSVVNTTRDALGQRAAELTRTIESVEEELAIAELEDAQASDQERRGSAAPSLEFHVHLDALQEPQALEISYVVDQARWWPTYSVFLDSKTREVTLELEALIVQDSGADWTSVELALSTAELDMDVRLPELASLRLGRKQASRPSGYRPPPEGLEALFAGFDAAQARLRQSPAETFGGAQHQVVYSPSPAESMMPPPPSGPAPPAPAMPQMSMAPMSASLGDMDMRVGGAAAPAKKRSIAPSPRRPAPPEPPSEIEPEEGWLNFERLRVAGPSSRRRGKLYRVADKIHHHSSTALGADAPAGLVDPFASRGNFDYRYDGQGRFQVPSDGRIHKVSLQQATGPVTWQWRCVPRVEKTVYREVRFENPFDVALLDGPARVFVDHEFCAKTKLSHVDRGGKVRLGLGIEERIQVLRNARFEEEGSGLLKGKRTLDHEVDITLRSNLAHPAEVEVIDRIPVSDEEHVRVELVKESPVSKEYDQSERGRTIRGGRLWTLSLSPHGEARIRFAYQVHIRAKEELVGGNRRED